MFIPSLPPCASDEAACALSYNLNTLGDKGAQHGSFVFPFNHFSTTMGINILTFAHAGL